MGGSGAHAGWLGLRRMPHISAVRGGRRSRGWSFTYPGFPGALRIMGQSGYRLELTRVAGAMWRRSWSSPRGLPSRRRCG